MVLRPYTDVVALNTPMPRRPRYDVVVIGAGPAGTAAAYYCARGGCSTLLIDRAEFPRAKTCGDGLMPTAVAAVRRMGVGNLDGHVVHGARFLHRSEGADYYEDFRCSPWPTTGLAVTRATLDNALLARSRAAGAEFIVGTARRLLMGSDGRARGLVVETPAGHREIDARIIVAASGCASGWLLGAKPGGNRRNIWGVAARTYMRLRHPAGHDLHLHFPLFSEQGPVSGYAWIFPVGSQQVNIGAGVIRTRTTRTVSPRRLLETFIADQISREERLDGAMRCEPVATAPLGLRPLLESSPGILLTGDLAGLANPFTGEGIGAALDSGTLAAEAILAGDADVNASYRDRLEGHFTHKFGLESLVQAAHGHPNFFLDRGCDLLLRPDRLVGTQVRTIIWDSPRTCSWWSALRVPAGRRAVHETRASLTHAARAIRPLLGALVEEATDEPGTSFGRYVAFGVACRSNRSGILSPTTLDGLLILEALRMIRELHWDLRRSALRDQEWGCDAVGLVLADALNAVILKKLCRMDAAWARELTIHASQMMRDAAAQAVSEETPRSETADAVMYETAGRLGLGRGPSDPLPPVIEAAAERLCVWESTGRGRLRDWQPSRHLPMVGPVPAPLTELFGILDAGAEVATVLCNSPMPRHGRVVSGVPESAAG